MMSEPFEHLRDALADRYVVERELGAGGMATVYLAHDLKHDRDVAIKVLHPELAAALGAERFLAEIKTTAKLQHPHILPLLDSGEAAGLLYYVMPYLKGESLRDRLNREKQLPIEDAVRIAREVADALGHAHGHGIIHRDIKPENILLQEGHALVADFGIALAVQSAGGQRMTQTGLSLGTPQYMSPEQAMGERSVDARADIYALGAVTYEMLTGEPPFTGATVQAIVARVMSEEPRPITGVRKSVPLQVEAAVLKALAKLPADRWASAAAFVAAAAGEHAGSPPAPVVGQRTVRLQHVVLGAAAVVVLVSAGAVLGRTLERGASFPPEVYDLTLPDSAPLLFVASKYGGTELSISHDGTFVVYTARRGEGTELWWRSLTTTEARRVTGTAGAHSPVLSPNDREVAFVANGEVRVAPVSGGKARTITVVGEDVGIEWPAPDSILVAKDIGGVMAWLSATGRELGRDSLASWCWTPTWGPQERAYLCANSKSYVVWMDRGSAGRAVVFAPNGSVPGAALRGSRPVWLDRSNLLVLGPDGELQAMRYRGRGTVGAAAVVLSGVRRENTMHAGQFAVSANGVLVYAPGNNDAHGELVAARSDGTAERLLAEPAPVVRWDVTPDGRMLAAVQELAAGDQLRITDRRAGREWTWLTAYHVGEPRWLPDGRLRVSVGREFGSEFSFDGIPLMEGDPVGATVVDTVVRSAPWTWESLSHDSVLVTAMGPNGFLGLMRLDGDAVSIDTLWVGPSWAATRSPDRRWIAHTTVRDNQYDVLLTSTAKGGVTHRVSSKGGLEPLWLTSSELVYRNDRTWYRVRIGSGRNDVVGRAETWFTDPAFLDTPGRSNSLLADGRLVYLRSTASSTTTLLRIIPRFRQSALRALRQR